MSTLTVTFQRVAFISLHQVQKLPGRPDTVLVSIQDRHYAPKLQPGFADVLVLDFDDHDPERDGLDALAEKFTPEQATQLREWVMTHGRATAPRNLLVHCNAGISRSAAIAWWVHREFGTPLSTRFPACYLNRHVLRLLNPDILPPAIPANAPSLYRLMSQTARVFDEAEWPW